MTKPKSPFAKQSVVHISWVLYDYFDFVSLWLHHFTPVHGAWHGAFISYATLTHTKSFKLRALHCFLVMLSQLFAEGTAESCSSRRSIWLCPNGPKIETNN